VVWEGRGDTVQAAADARLRFRVQQRDGTLVFPYAFPEPGDYRVWVQFVREGRNVIETAVFDALVR
jgi:hypothetical protein